jgi:hypothetical protein
MSATTEAAPAKRYSAAPGKKRPRPDDAPEADIKYQPTGNESKPERLQQGFVWTKQRNLVYCNYHQQGPAICRMVGTENGSPNAGDLFFTCGRCMDDPKEGKEPEVGRFLGWDDLVAHVPKFKANPFNRAKAYSSLAEAEKDGRGASAPALAPQPAAILQAPSDYEMLVKRMDVLERKVDKLLFPVKTTVDTMEDEHAATQPVE